MRWTMIVSRIFTGNLVKWDGRIVGVSGEALTESILRISAKFDSTYAPRCSLCRRQMIMHVEERYGE